MSRNGFVDDARQLISTAPSGSVEITVLIKDKRYANAITCYDIEAEFKSIIDVINDTLNNDTDLTINEVVNEIIDKIENITNDTSFIENPDIAVSVVSIIDDIYQNNQTNLTQQTAQELVDDVIQNIVSGSRQSQGSYNIAIQVQNGEQNWLELSNAIITELSIMSEITKSEDIVDVATSTKTLVYDWLDPVSNTVDIFIDASSTDNTNDTLSQQQSYTIASKLQQLIGNLENTLDIDPQIGTNDTSAIDLQNDLSNELIEYALLAAAKALAPSNIGESFYYESETITHDGSIIEKVVTCTKFETNIDFNDTSINLANIDLPSCGVNEQSVELPIAFLQQQSGILYCAFMSSTRNSFVSAENQNEGRQQNSDFISTNVYGEQNTDISRRRLQQLIEQESDRCSPYLITMQLSDIDNAYTLNTNLDQEYNFPSCDFWNVNNSFWDSRACFVYNITDDIITCGCTRLSTFSVSKDQIYAEASILPGLDWRKLTVHNLWEYPTVWITFLILFIIFMTLCLINPMSKEKDSRSVIAYEDIIYKSFQEQKLWADILGVEIKLITDHMPNQHRLGQGIKLVAKEAKKELCYLQFKLFKAYLKNDHTLLSVFQRSAGTNFSVKQRLGCFFMYLCTIMVAAAAFYSLSEQSTPVQDVLASFAISLFGTIPVWIIRKIFEKSKPREVKSEKHSIKRLMEEMKDSNNGKSLDVFKEDAGQRPTTTTDSQRQSYHSKTWSVDGIMIERGKSITPAVLKQEMDKIYDDNEDAKIVQASDIRQYFFKSMFPLPSWCKYIAWILLILWCIAAFIVTLVYGLQFDMEYSVKDNLNNENYEIYTQNEACWDTSLALRSESELSQEYFNQKILEKQVENSASYGESDTGSWLLSVAQALVTSLLLWQPLTIYIMTWLKIWMFTWHLKMKVGPGNIILLCKRCCCGYDKGNESREDLEDEQERPQFIVHDDDSDEEKHQKSNITKVIANKNRPVDIISFLGDETWIIDDIKNKNYESVRNEANPLLNAGGIEEKSNEDDEDLVSSLSKQPNDNKQEIEMRQIPKKVETDEEKQHTPNQPLNIANVPSISAVRSRFKVRNLRKNTHIKVESQEIETADVAEFKINDVSYGDDNVDEENQSEEKQSVLNENDAHIE